jgi:hypothetical protein
MAAFELAIDFDRRFRRCSIIPRKSSVADLRSAERIL